LFEPAANYQCCTDFGGPFTHDIHAEVVANRFGIPKPLTVI
jgi:hypothetical protein